MFGADHAYQKQNSKDAKGNALQDAKRAGHDAIENLKINAGQQDRYHNDESHEISLSHISAARQTSFEESIVQRLYPLVHLPMP